MVIRENIPGRRAYRNYSTNSKKVAKELERLSTGYQINRSADDAAGLAISEKMRAEITGLGRAENNAKEGVDLVRTAEGALDAMHEMARRLLALAEESANGTYEDEVDRAQLQKEVDNIKAEFDRIADATNHNGVFMLRTDSISRFDAVSETSELPLDPAVADVALKDGNLEFTSDAVLLGQSDWTAPSISRTNGIALRTLEAGKEPTITKTAGQPGAVIQDVTLLNGEAGSENSMGVTNQVWTKNKRNISASAQTDIKNALNGITSANIRLTCITNPDNHLKLTLKAECDPPLSLIQDTFDVTFNKKSDGSAETYQYSSFGVYVKGSDSMYPMGSFSFQLPSYAAVGSYADFTLSPTLESVEVNPTPAQTALNFSGQYGRDLFNGKIEVGPGGSQGKYQFVASGDTAEAGYTAVTLEANDSASTIARKLCSAMASSSSDYTYNYYSGQVTVRRQTTDKTADAPEVTFEKKEYAGRRANTTVDFTGKTGKDLINSIFLVGSQGKYQFVSASGDHRSVTAQGCTEIALNEDDDASAIAAAVASALSATAAENLPNFDITASDSKLLITEKTAAGAGAVSVTAQQITNGEAAQTVIDFKGATGAAMRGKRMQIGDYGANGKYQFVYNASEADAGYEAIVIQKEYDAQMIADLLKQKIKAHGISGYDLLDNTGEKLILRELQNQGKPLEVSTSSQSVPDSLLQSMQNHHATTGKINIYLSWAGTKGDGVLDGSDLDLSCKFTDSAYSHTLSKRSDGDTYAYYKGMPIGRLQFDMNASEGTYYSEDDPAEHIYYTDPQTGTYTITVDRARNSVHNDRALEVTTAQLAYKVGSEWSPIQTFELRAGENKSFTFSYDADAVNVPLITMDEGVRKSDIEPATIGTKALTTADFTGLVGKQLYGGTMHIQYSQGDISVDDTYQFAERAEDVEDGMTPILLNQTDNARTIAEKVRACIDQNTGRIDGFHTYTDDGAFKWEENDIRGRRAVPVRCTMPPEETDDGTGDKKAEDPYHIRLLVGTTAERHNWVEVPKFNMHADAIGLGSADVSTQSRALDSINVIRDSINFISDVRGQYGAIQNRLEHTIQNQSAMRINTQEAESLIRDTDVAEEMMKHTKNNILMQTSEVMLSQASKSPEQVLSLLQ